MAEYKKCGACLGQVGSNVAIVVQDTDGDDTWCCDWVCAAFYCLNQKLSETEAKS